MPGIANEHALMRPLDDKGRASSALPGRRRTVGRLAAARQFLDGLGGLGWSVIGFVGGAVFWHFVGFWSFVSEVVLAGGPERSAAPPVAMTMSMRVADASPSGVSSSAAACTVLVLDRRTGATSARACDGVHVALPGDAVEGREDRALAKGPFGGGPSHPGRR